MPTFDQKFGYICLSKTYLSSKNPVLCRKTTPNKKNRDGLRRVWQVYIQKPGLLVRLETGLNVIRHKWLITANLD